MQKTGAKCIGYAHVSARFSSGALADGRFDAVRIDRSLQHIAEPGRLVREMARVARRGAVVLCAEPDRGTFLLGGSHTAVTERILHDWIRTFQNPWIGRALPSQPPGRRRGERSPPGGPVAAQPWVCRVESSARNRCQLQGSLRRTPHGPQLAKAYRQGEAYAGVLLMICWGRMH
jgi:ubiquinone/menaquinone biosynthesis C-methylase UbiE